MDSKIQNFVDDADNLPDCSVCGKQMDYEIDDAAETVWYSCPVYLAGPEGQEHDSFGTTFTKIRTHNDLSGYEDA